MANTGNGGWLTAKQVAGLCGITEAYLTLRRQRRLAPPYHRIGGKVLYRQSDIDAWIASTRHEPDSA